jgi:hypothetical protein
MSLKTTFLNALSSTAAALKKKNEQAVALCWKLDFKKPQNLEELRMHMAWKLQQYYAEGYFFFSLAGLDSHPFILISSPDTKEKGVLEAYHTMSHNYRKAPYVSGTYTCANRIYTFTCNEEPFPNSRMNVQPKDYAQYLKDYTGPKRDQVQEAFWTLFGPITENLPTQIFLEAGGKKIPLLPKKTKKGEWTVAEWNLVRVLTAAKGQSVLKSDPITSPHPRNGGLFVTAHGLQIPEDGVIRLVVSGAMAGSAQEETTMLEIMRDGVAEIFAEHLEEFKGKLLAADRMLEGADDKAQKKALLAFNHALEELEESFCRDALVHVGQKWLLHMETDFAKRRFNLKLAASFLKNVAGTVTGTVAAVSSSPSGIGAVLGLTMTLRKGIGAVADLYTFFRDINKLQKLLNYQLAYHAIKFLQNGGTEDWKEVGKGFLGYLKISPGVNMLSDLVGGEGKLKTVADLEKDVTEYEAKTSKLRASAESYLKHANRTMKIADEFGELTDAIENPKLKATLKAGESELRELLADRWIKMAGQTLEQTIAYAESISLYRDLIKTIKSAQWTSESAKIVDAAFMPILRVAVKLRPSDLAGNAYLVVNGIYEEKTNITELREFLAKNAPKKEADELAKLQVEVLQKAAELKQKETK